MYTGRRQGGWVGAPVFFEKRVSVDTPQRGQGTYFQTGLEEDGTTETQGEPEQVTRAEFGGRCGEMRSQTGLLAKVELFGGRDGQTITSWWGGGEDQILLCKRGGFWGAENLGKP